SHNICFATHQDHLVKWSVHSKLILSHILTPLYTPPNTTFSSSAAVQYKHEDQGPPGRYPQIGAARRPPNRADRPFALVGGERNSSLARGEASPRFLRGALAAYRAWHPAQLYPVAPRDNIPRPLVVIHTGLTPGCLPIREMSDA